MKKCNRSHIPNEETRKAIKEVEQRKNLTVIDDLDEYLKNLSNSPKITQKDGKYWVSSMPSINVSGYGDTKQDSLNDLDYNVGVFKDDLSRAKRNL